MSALVSVSGCTGDSGSSAERAKARTAGLTETPAPEPTAAPTADPTEAPTPEPTAAPTADPTEAPTPEPTAALTAGPTQRPIPEPTATPTVGPTPVPTMAPTAKPTAPPTVREYGHPDIWDVPCSFLDALFVTGEVQWSPDGARILFTGSLNHDDPSVYVVEADGSRLEGIKGIEEAPGGLVSGYIEPMRTFDVSADGSKIAYSTCEYDGSSDDNYEILVSNIDGTGVKKMRGLYPTSAQNLYPVWSPDGTRVALARALPPLTGRRRVLTIHTVATGESTDVRISKTDVFERRPVDKFPSVAMHPLAWSPDGGSLAFLGDITRLSDTGRPLVEGTELHVYTVGPDGSGLKRIVSNAVSAPSWSPAGERIAVAVAEGDGAALYTFAADGSDPVMVTRVAAKDMVNRSGDLSYYPAALWVPNVSWSPDGSKIMYGALSVVNVDDGSVVLDTQPIRFEWFGLYGRRHVKDAGALSLAASLAAWSPDSSRIAVLARIGVQLGEGDPLLYTMSSDGTDLRILLGVIQGGKAIWPLPVRPPGDVEACSMGVVVRNPEENPGLVEDCRTLLRMRDKIAGFGPRTLGWRSDIWINWWGGVGVSGEPLRVRALEIGTSRLYGQIPPEIGNLVGLRELTIEMTEINGRIPAEIGRLANLESLELRNTHMGGRIPAEIGNLTNLKRLVLNGSQFSGGIPPEIGRLTNLTHLDLADNELTGSIPSELSNLFSLTYLDLHFNRLTGCIPDPHQPRIRRCN